MSRAPAHLSSQRRELWREIAETYPLEAQHFALLTAACELLDRADEARLLVAKQGILINGRFGSRANPACAIEAQAKTAAARLLRELGLGGDDPGDSRPPRPAGRY